MYLPCDCLTTPYVGPSPQADNHCINVRVVVVELI